MRYCKGHKATLNDDQFSGDYNYCQSCYISYKSKPRSNQRLKNPTCVYFIRSGDLIKIGYTSDLEERKRNLQVSNPTIIEVLKTIPGGYPEEQQLHKRFAHLNKTGEWFYAVQELTDFIQSI